MKYKEIMKTNETNKNGFLITCVFSILLLLTLCYFGVNSSTKGTSAATTDYVCVSGYEVVEREYYDEYYCCKTGYTYYGDYNGTEYCIPAGTSIQSYYSQKVRVVTATLTGNYATDSDALDNACETQYPGSVRVSGSGMYLSDGTTIVSCRQDLSYFGSVALDVRPSGSGCYLANSLLGSAAIYQWTNSQNIITSQSYHYYSQYTTESACLANNKCYIGSSGNFYWGYVYDASAKGYTEYSSYTTASKCTGVYGYNINYVLNGGTKGSNAPTTAVLNKWAKIDNPTKVITTSVSANGTGATIGSNTSSTQTFAGWTYSTSGDATGAMKGVATGTTVTGYEWEEGTLAGSAYTNFLNLSSTVNSTVTMTASWTPKALTLPTVTKSGYTCTWNTKSDGTGTSYASGATITPSATSSATLPLYAMCTSNATTKGATFYPNGGTLSGSKTATCTTTGSYCTLAASDVPTATRTGYTFGGWNTKTDSTCYASNNLKVWVSDVDFYACWTANTYSVVYNGNGSTSGSMSNSSHTYDTAKALTKNAYVKTGYSFKEWNTKADGSGTSYADAASVKNLTSTKGGTVTLYAQWTVNTTTTKTATIPTNSLCVARTYNGNKQQLTSVTSGAGYTLSGYEQTNAGTYTITATLSSGYKWSDSTTGTKTFSCSIAKASPTLSVTQPINVEVSKTNTSTYTYNGDGVVSCSVANTSVATCSVNTSTKQVTITGKSAGTTTLTLSAAAGTNYSADSATATVNVSASSSGGSTTQTATIPTASLCKSGLTYTGNKQQLTSVTSGTGYTLSGYEQTNVGTYPITATLASGYTWSDNTTGTKTFSCSIARANPTLSLSSYSAVTTVDKTKTLTYTYNGDGTVSCSPMNSSIVSCSVSGGKLTITPKSEGTTSVSLIASQGTNYNTVSQQVVVIINSSGGNEEIPTNTYKATFDANGGILSGNKDKSCSTTSTSCTITGLPTASKDGYTFKGWGTSSSCTSGNTNGLTLNGNKTYYACYVKNSSGGTTNPSTDDTGNTTTNPGTGEITIAIVWFVGIFAIAYAAWYFRKVKEN